jgi:hypothetical protein
MATDLLRLLARKDSPAVTSFGQAGSEFFYRGHTGCFHLAKTARLLEKINIPCLGQAFPGICLLPVFRTVECPHGPFHTAL